VLVTGRLLSQPGKIDTLYRMNAVSRSGEPVTIWERPDPAQRAPVEPLSRPVVVAAAIGLADDDGLAAVSVRRLAAALGVGPMRLYRVFDSVAELTELMVDAAYGEVVRRLADPDRRAESKSGWRAQIRDILIETRAVILEHEWLADVLGRRPHLGPHGLAWLELMTEAVARAPAVRGTGGTWAALGVTNGFLIGAVRREVADRRAARAGDGEPEWQQRMGPYLGRMLDTGRFPALRELITGPAETDPDRSFRDEVELLLAGLADAGRGRPRR
jgi:AcrR family transcriptional regulator